MILIGNVKTRCIYLYGESDVTFQLRHTNQQKEKRFALCTYQFTVNKSAKDFQFFMTVSKLLYRNVDVTTRLFTFDTLKICMNT